MKATLGLIFDIQRFSIHDGPGIRTTVFFKGCPLRCAWCQNPESISRRSEILFSASACVDCGRCAEACSRGAISPGGRGRIDATRCIGCGCCVDACAARALQRVGREMTVREVLEEVMKDAAYYRRSGGGMTLSGGEPLLQTEFVVELLREARRGEVTSVVETAGHVPAEAVEAVVPLADLFFFDLKLMDSSLHHRFTGAGNELVLANARLLVSRGVEVQWRLPLIPGINDGDENIDRTAAFVREQGASLLRIVPYQRTYLAKGLAARSPEEIRAIAPPTPELLARVRERLAGAGLDVEIDA